MERDSVEERTKPQDNVAPALASGGAVIEFPKEAAKSSLLGVRCCNSKAGETIEDAELLFAQSLVDADFFLRLAAARRAKNLGSLDRPDIG